MPPEYFSTVLVLIAESELELRNHIHPD